MSARRLPPEWAPQAAMLLVWPRSAGDWGGCLAAARDTIATMAAVLAERQPVILVAADAECRQSIDDHPQLRDATPPVVVDAPNDDIWVRDTGPLTVFDDERVFVDFRFDGWGGRFSAHNDDRLTVALHAAGVLGRGTLERRSAVLEGGSIESSGTGALLTTERCLLAGRRNPGLNRAGVEAMLEDAFGANTIHWLAHGDLIGDDTDGHIDTLARFVAADTIAYQGCADDTDPHFAQLSAMRRELEELRDPNGTAYRLVELPLPAPIHDLDDGHGLPAGYANFVIANGCVLIPAFDDPADAVARQRLAECFPEREIVPIDSRALIRQHGGLHCASMQIAVETTHG